MIYNYNKRLVGTAKALRRNMTDEEKRLWYDFLKKLPVTVNRQKNIGNYIVDFFVASKRIVIEIDGVGHKHPKAREKDEQRDFELQSLGITVLRYSNTAIRENFDGVCQSIWEHLEL